MTSCSFSFSIQPVGELMKERLILAGSGESQWVIHIYIYFPKNNLRGDRGKV